MSVNERVRARKGEERETERNMREGRKGRQREEAIDKDGYLQDPA